MKGFASKDQPSSSAVYLARPRRRKQIAREDILTTKLLGTQNLSGNNLFDDDLTIYLFRPSLSPHAPLPRWIILVWFFVCVIKDISCIAIVNCVESWLRLQDNDRTLSQIIRGDARFPWPA